MNEAADQVPRHLNFISRMQLPGKSNEYIPWVCNTYKISIVKLWGSGAKILYSLAV